MDDKEFLLLSNISVVSFLELFFDFEVLFELILCWKSYSVNSLKIVQVLIT